MSFQSIADIDGFVEVKFQRRQKKIVSKFCKVCKDAGKTEAEYTSHFVRATPAKNAPVVCPTLLALNCNYCHKKGHTIRYCPVLERNGGYTPYVKEDEKVVEDCHCDDSMPELLKHIMEDAQTTNYCVGNVSPSEDVQFVPLSVVSKSKHFAFDAEKPTPPSYEIVIEQYKEKTEEDEKDKEISELRSKIEYLEKMVTHLYDQINQHSKATPDPVYIHSSTQTTPIQYEISYSHVDDEEMGWGDYPMSDDEQ